jgi:hypothetical protein
MKLLQVFSALALGLILSVSVKSQAVEVRDLQLGETCDLEVGPSCAEDFACTVPEGLPTRLGTCQYLPLGATCDLDVGPKCVPGTICTVPPGLPTRKGKCK